ncbi:restriction endonuclease subunit S [Macrococcoides bohemicum]|uniref:restriction endonuclease subunit S n=1 Tax=Macrococcoides bohemicum TaxID=1903056 RepID=UPI00105A7425|nr:restriction endonuclease subunit S [Macrococcus bohemicus]TDL33807.1 restriction endonuclease subunit S [Macrococcus bohemicus]
MSNVPDIRFKGFTDAWEQRELGNESKIIAGGDVDKTKLQLVGKYPVLANALTNDGVVGYYDQDYHIEAPAITVTGRGNVGHAKARKVNFTPVVRLLAIKTHHDIDFLEHSINLYRKINESTGVPQLTSPQLAKYKLLIPENEEQKILGSFLKKFDDVITLLQRELNHKIDTKKQVVNNIFPNKNQINPNIRFQKHDKYWETVKANEIFKTVSDKGYPELPVLSASQLSGMVLRERNGINIIHNSDNEISYKRVMPGDYVIHLRSFQGGFAYSEIEGITSPAYTVMRLRSNEHNKYFWKYYFSSFYFIKLLELVTYGIRDGKSISFSDFSTLYMKYPSKEEQDLICKLLRNFDRTIDSLQKEIELLQKMKKGFLQKLFPKGD